MQMAQDAQYQCEQNCDPFGHGWPCTQPPETRTSFSIAL